MNARIIGRNIGALFVLALALGAQAAEPIRISGTGAAVGAMERLAAEFRKSHPQARFAPVEAIGSPGAVRAVLAGALDIAVISRPLKDSERAAGAQAIEYARTPFVIAVSVKLPVNAVSRTELARIYDGDLQTWPGGTRVRPVLRDPEDTDTLMVSSFAPEIGAAMQKALRRPGMLIANTDREAADIVERVVGAIAPSTLGLIQSEARALRVLALDGVTPSLETLESGAWPHHKRLYMASGAKGFTPQAARFVEFVGSPKGRALLRHTGHLVPPFRGD